jgi:hypothetical protein
VSATLIRAILDAYEYFAQLPEPSGKLRTDAVKEGSGFGIGELPCFFVEVVRGNFGDDAGFAVPPRLQAPHLFDADGIGAAPLQDQNACVIGNGAPEDRLDAEMNPSQIQYRASVMLSNLSPSPLDLIDCTAAFSPFLETAKIAHVLVSQIVQGFACQRRSSAGGTVHKHGLVAIER